MSLTICAIPGDGIGREVIPAAVYVLQAAVPALEVVWADAGYETWRHTGQALPESTLNEARNAAATLFGAVSSPLQPTPGYSSAILELRRKLDLYACVRPVRGLYSLPGTSGAAPDLIIVRENTEGLYGGGEQSDGETAVARRVITRRASQRVAHLAFDMARRLGRSRVTIVHKATVLPETCGMFRSAAFDVATGYPDIAVDEMLVDSAALLLASRPEKFDVILTTNLFGDILSDVAAMHGGGLGLVASANIGDAHAVFEPVHGSAPDIAGRGIANPLAAILGGAMLLEHVGEHRAALAVRASIAALASESRVGAPLTPDMGGSAGTADVTAAVISGLGRADMVMNRATRPHENPPRRRTATRERVVAVSIRT